MADLKRSCVVTSSYVSILSVFGVAVHIETRPCGIRTYLCIYHLVEKYKVIEQNPGSRG